MNRAYYEASVKTFLSQSEIQILGFLATNNQFRLEELQRNTWIKQIQILKRELAGIQGGYILFEYTIPRIGNRIDTVLLYNGLIFLFEFKVGEYQFSEEAKDQVIDYALDLKNFHKESHDQKIIPIVVATNASHLLFHGHFSKDGIFDVVLCNDKNISKLMEHFSQYFSDSIIDPKKWRDSIYMPTPTIIEAAQALYRGHSVAEISRSDAGATNLTATTNAINRIIEDSKRNCKKSICLVTGVPGSGKTLAGLNIANERHRFDETEHAVFLSGNQPLVDVLQEALARDEFKHNGTPKSAALRKAKSFIQIIHHFRDDAISVPNAPIEKVAIFDEAQRAWDKPSLDNFMKRKKGISDFGMSEPEFLIRIMNRHDDWAVIVCLIGGGQEINTGEAGIKEWFEALRNKFPNWCIFVSDRLEDNEYIGDQALEQYLSGLDYQIVEDLHLSVSLRSFRSEKVSEFVKALLDVDLNHAKAVYQDLQKNYPIVMTRDIVKAKHWVQTHARGTERYGITASSGARRLRKYGVWVQSKIEAKNWFLNAKQDVRSSYFLEETATEFDIQGLELDWTIICWDANMRFEHTAFQYYDFKGAKWQRVNNLVAKSYIKNTYRVLLTRARQGFVIFVPPGDEDDYSRPREYYDGIYEYLKLIGIESID